MNSEIPGASETIETKILKWFKKTGFPLEMAAADAFNRAGFEVRQSEPYVDPETPKTREIDVLAVDPDWKGIINVEFILECKSSVHPWIVLCSENALANFNRITAFSISSEAGSLAIARNLGELRSRISIVRSDDSGYGFRQALGDRSDVAYAATMNVLKACLARKRLSEAQPYMTLSFYVPVIVVDSPLFECRLEPTGELALKEVQRSEFLFRTHMPDPIGCCIRVVTKKELSSWAAEAKVLATTLREDFEEEERSVLNDLDRG
ncbi:hypothetical protein LJR099_003042 [Variovorax paradoxus]|uniref:hypothetical protein n=1 Tax=Variovorax paradoxus TaxID=34073 RepID=UPI00399AD2CE